MTKVERKEVKARTTKVSAKEMEKAKEARKEKAKDKGGKSGKGTGGGTNQSGYNRDDKQKKIGPCWHCGKQGHIASDCWLKAGVRSVEEMATTSNLQNQHGASAGSATGSAGPSSVSSATTSSNPTVRRVSALTHRLVTPPDMSTRQIFELNEDEPMLNWEDDLSDFHVARVTSESEEPEQVADHDMTNLEFHAAPQQVFDMTTTDHDGNWSVCGCSIMPNGCAVFDVNSTDLELYETIGYGPYSFSAGSSDHVCAVSAFSDAVSAEGIAVQDELVRKVTSGGSSQFEAILDLGADVSVIPYSFQHLGESKAGPTTTLRDAQGKAIPSQGESRIMSMWMSTDTGEFVEIVETFVIAKVTKPLLCLGKLLKQGWSVTQSAADSRFFLVKDDVKIPLHWRRNALAMSFSTEGPMIQYVVALTDEWKDAVNRPGWRYLTDGTPCHVAYKSMDFYDPSGTFAPADFPYRSTLVQAPTGEYELWECSEDYSIREDRSESLEVPIPRTVITFVHSQMIDLKEYFGEDIGKPVVRPSEAAPGDTNMEVDKPKRAAGAVAQQVGQKQRFAKLDGLTVWVRQDEGLRYAPSTVEAGPLWATVYKRVVKDMSTGEVVLDQDTKGKTVQECFYRLPDTVKATETTFYYDVLAVPGMDPDFKVVKSDVGEVQIEFLGATLSDVSPLRELRRACKQLGIPQSGSKSVCFQRLRHHLEEGHSTKPSRMKCGSLRSHRCL